VRTIAYFEDLLKEVERAGRRRQRKSMTDRRRPSAASLPLVLGVWTRARIAMIGEEYADEATSG
jgi:hypothetical protein